MTIDDMLTESADVLDQMIAVDLAAFSRMLASHGATNDEIAEALAGRRAELEADKARQLGEIEFMLTHWDEAHSGRRH